MFSGIVSKVAAYGFLRIVLPLFPYATVHFQMLMLVIALVSILYATALAFTTTDARLVVAYSSVAQLSFITLGIFSLRPDGAQGALLQMVNHALVTAPLFFIVAALAVRAGGSENLRDMGGLAFRAPVLAALFLIVALAWLAMPGSPNFTGEFLILLGVFQSKLVIAVIAFVGVVGAAVLRAADVHPSMHNRVGPRGTSREIGLSDAAVLVPLVARDPRARVLSAVRAQAAPSHGEGDSRPDHRCAGWRRDERSSARPATIPTSPARTSTGPALSPIVALAGGALVVLLVGLLPRAFVREQIVPAAGAGHARRWRLASRSGASTTTPRSSRARW